METTINLIIIELTLKDEVQCEATWTFPVLNPQL